MTLAWPHHPFRGHGQPCPTTDQACRYGQPGSCAQCAYRHRAAGFPLPPSETAISQPRGDE